MKNVKVSVLASGSTGNTSLIETKHHKILMDAGLSGKKIKELLSQVGVDINEIDLAFLSHDHSDHSKGLGILMRRYPRLNAYANSGTWDYLIKENKIGKLPVEQINTIEPGEEKSFDDLTVRAFATSHDAAQPQYYVFKSAGKKMAFLTDTGYVSKKVIQVIKDCDAYLMEYNYDNQMLRDGPYSWQLKARILSDYGHLSNDQASSVLGEILSKRTKRVYLAHRSQHNNSLELAHQNLVNYLQQHQIDLPDLKIIDTYPDHPTELVSI
ncbi:beta-lactamase superfamily hydrolase [Lactobacillus psittaci DSM 15354]|uniref:Beta-lactamase superfamily hydrolase n=1 Tax=Lactobacillus psittaci DSM 15354 TaxID=1122152 RepID=A0A0R1S8X2_9LACO|nr:beta-lactamase superfamily hydrolase [Lactobacillus psittaci DSM 15354]